MSCKTFARCDRAKGEDGLSILETILALSLFALVIVGVAASAGAGLRLTGVSNSRQAATQVATEHIELLRSAEFTSLGMPTGTTYDGAGTPDENVSSGQYLVPLSNPVTEPLVVGTTLPGGHKPAVVEIGARKFQVYQYVTDPAGTNVEKRVTVVVAFRDTSATGGTEQLAFSSVVAPGSIGFASTTTTTASATTVPPTTPTTATPTTLPTTPCPGDTAGPVATRFEIAGGTGGNSTEYVNGNSVQLKAYATDSCTPVKVAFSNDNITYGSLNTISVNPEVLGWDLIPGDGLKTVWFRFVDPSGNVTLKTDTVNLDTFTPTAPTAFTGSSSKNGNDLDVALTWPNDARDGSPTSYVSSYQIFRRSTASGTFTSQGSVTIGTGSGQCLATAASCNFSQSKIDGSVSWSFYVVAVDQAGNISPATVIRTCSKPSGNSVVACS